MTEYKPYILALVLFILLFLLRVHQVGGLRPASFSQSPEQSNSLENFGLYLSDRSQDILPEPQASLLSGMLLGVKKNLPKDFNQALVNTSTIHIVVVSGENLSLVAGFIMFLVPFLGRKKTIGLALLVIILYSAMTGFQVPVIRAALMVGLSFLAQLLGRDRDGPWVLSLTGALMLLFNPNWLFSISFQLSFLATFGVIVVAPELVKRLRALPGVIRQDLGVSLSAQILTMPIIAFNFHQISLVGILANMLVLWTVSLIMIFGALALVGALVSLTLGSLLAFVPGVFLNYFVYIIYFFNNLPFASLSIGDTSVIFWAGYYIFLSGVFLQLRKGRSSGEVLAMVN